MLAKYELCVCVTFLKDEENNFKTLKKRNYYFRYFLIYNFFIF